MNLTETEIDLIEIGYEMIVGHIEDKKNWRVRFAVLGLKM